MDERGLRWLVTAGPTCEDIDPVRFVSNRSSGRMGYAVARAAVQWGGHVTLVSGPVALEPPDGCDVVRVRSAREMFEAVTARFGSVDVVVMTAAVADFRPKSRSPGKVKRTAAGLTLEMEPTEDILAELGRRKRERGLGQILVGFALESPEEGAAEGGGATPAMCQLARKKLESKGLDVICLNAPAAAGSERSALSVLVREPGGPARWDDWGRLAKEEHARRLVELAAGMVLAR